MPIDGRPGVPGSDPGRIATTISAVTVAATTRRHTVELFALFLLAAFALLATPIAALLAWVRVSRNDARQRELAQRLAVIEARLARLTTRIAEGAEPARSAPADPHEPSEPPRTTAPSASPKPPPLDLDVPSSSPPPPRPAPIPPSRTPAETPQASSALDIDWERWIGIRGAAVLGAVALGLAALLFFKFSIERGLITPPMRVALGIVTGLGCLAGSEWLVLRRYRQTAEGVAGAAIVVLYATFWAAHVRYSLVGMPLAFGLMALVTVACGLMAIRRSSLIVAVLGLVGGFATPLLLASGTDRPIGLFGYVLLLDVGLLIVGQRRRWPSLGLLGLAGTVLLQALWIVGRMGPERTLLGLAIVAIFSAVFLVATGASPRWWWTRLGAIAFPFVFAVYFAGRVELGAHLLPLAALLALLVAAACWISRGQGRYAVGVGAATASVAVVGVWLLGHRPIGGAAWELVGTAVGLALVAHAFVELESHREGAGGPAPAALVAAVGMFVLTLSASIAGNGDPWPWVVSWIALGATLERHSAFAGRAALQLVAAVGGGIGLSLLHLAHTGDPARPGAPLLLALLVAGSLVPLGVALLRRHGAVGVFAAHAAVVVPLLVLIGLALSPITPTLGPWPALGSALLIGALAATAATRSGRGSWYAAAVAATAVAHIAWGLTRLVGVRHADPRSALLAFGAAVVLFTAWPLVARGRIAGDRVTWCAAALAGPAWFLPARRAFELAFGGAAIGVLPLALGALALIVAVRARATLPPDSAPRRSAVVWLAAVAVCLLSIAIPLQLEREWITIGWAIEGLALLGLWRRLDHPGLKYFALGLLVASTVRLVANPALLGYYPRPTLRLVNWLMYTYLIPALALLASARLLARDEVGRARDRERWIYTPPRPVGAIVATISAIAVVFVWINLAIVDWYATGTRLTWSFGEDPAQRLTISIAWAVYALVLLGSGMVRRSLGLRWISLAFLLVTIGKVFLYDLGALEDLYRVASLVGLAASLILVSLLYQRFVFRTAHEEDR